jgi:isoamylase
MLERIKILPGRPFPLGFSLEGNKANFVLFSSSAPRIFLVLFNGTEKREIPLKRAGDVWYIGISDLPENTEYAFQVEGPYEKLYLADPYTKTPASAPNWGEGLQSTRSYCKVPPPFDWQGAKAPQIAPQDLIVYEMHTRGFTKHPSSQTAHPGTFLGVIEKIPHLKKLGVNAIELLPIFEFDEHLEDHRINYWGYNSLCFFAPMRRFAKKDPIYEFKTLVREMHKNGIEVWLDVVYNHTGETKNLKHAVNFRGIDNAVYYMLDSEGHNLDYAGCFNTFNVNHPVVLQFILDSLHYWAVEMKVDGFRFDLASIFNRGVDQGHLIHPSPLIEAITSDPILKNVKLIAEPWDATGLYQVGQFAKATRWSEWNGLYRDFTRRFIKGSDGMTPEFAKVLCGSQFLFESSSPLSSLNFITAHDGFTLRDLVSYQNKRNFNNGEMNKDGNDHNDNWNCGCEGESHDPSIQLLRERQMRNFFLALFLSQGIPMLKMGDEYGHTSLGNNNPYVQDNEVSWFLWNELEKHELIFDFVSSLIHFRKKHPSLRYPHFLTDKEIEWHGTEPFSPNWDESSRFIAFTLKGEHPIYVAFNADYLSKKVHLPPNIFWKKVVQTDQFWDQHHLKDPENGEPISSIELIPYSAFIAKGSSLKE